MNKALIAFNQDFSGFEVHSNCSLSSLVEPIESLVGSVLVTQPGLYDLEVYLDRGFYDSLVQRAALKTKLRLLFGEFGIALESQL